MNNDIYITPVGGEDAQNKLPNHPPIGTTRTKAWMQEGPSAGAWTNAIKAGRTYVSTGPLVSFTTGYQDQRAGIGERMQLPPEGGEVEVRGEAVCITPITKVVVYRNGEVWKEIPVGTDPRRVEFRESTKVDRSSWFGLVVEAEPYPAGGAPDGYAQAVTNGVRVYVGDQKIRNRASAEYFLQWIDKLQAMADNWFGWRSQKEKDHVFAQFEEARKVYRQRIAEAQ
jgi:hypothetical protein